MSNIWGQKLGFIFFFTIAHSRWKGSPLKWFNRTYRGQQHIVYQNASCPVKQEGYVFNWGQGELEKIPNIKLGSQESMAERDNKA